jgi:hypothetical protein
VSGGAVPVAPSIESWAFKYLGNYSAAGNRLVYREAATPEARVDWFDPRTGAKTALLERGPYIRLRLSKDGCAAAEWRGLSHSWARLVLQQLTSDRFSCRERW